MRPALAAAGLPSGEGWGFHEFRHTVVSRLIAEGRSVVQVAHWIGDTPEVVLSTYAHLFESDLDGPLEAEPLPDQVSDRSAAGQHVGKRKAAPESLDSALESESER